MADLIKVLLFSLLSIAFLFIISRIAGKKQIAQLNLVDFVFAISVGSIAAAMATDTSNTPFYHYLVAMGVFVLVEVVLSFAERKGKFLKTILKGKPTTIINEGQINYKNLKKSKLDINEFIMLCRNLGYFDLKDIAFAIFETNGQLSILPIGAQKPTVAEDLNIIIEEAKLPTYFVAEGKLESKAIKQAGKTKQWLFERLQIKNKKDIKKILLVSYDEKNDSLITIKKQ